MQKNAKFSNAGRSAPRPPCLRRLVALPPDPQPPAAGGFAPRPPLASGGWGLRFQTPKQSPPHCEFLATRLIEWLVAQRIKRSQSGRGGRYCSTFLVPLSVSSVLFQKCIVFGTIDTFFSLLSSVIATRNFFCDLFEMEV